MPTFQSESNMAFSDQDPSPNKGSLATDNKITIQINSHINNTAPAACAIRGVCRLLSFSEDEQAQVELCVAEVINNSIEHAYAKQAGHEIWIDCKLKDDSIELDVFDQGTAMDPMILANASTHAAAPDPENPKTWNLRGRGLMIVKSYMDLVSYRSENGVNCFSMSKLKNADEIS
jgi:anti-sigma regulatory factor (Ser/Thr protein kinase)